MLFFVGLVLVALVGLVLTKYIKFKKLRRLYNSIPTPKDEHWLYGHGYKVKNIQKEASKERELLFKSNSYHAQKGELDWSKMYSKWNDECGSIYHIRMFNRILVVIGDPQIAKDLLIKGQNSYKQNHKYQRPLHNFSVFPFNQKLEPDKIETGNIFGASLQTSRGDQWRWRRKLMSPMFSNHALLSNEILHFIQKEALHLCTNIENQLKKNSIIQMDFLLYRSSLNVICWFLFGNHKMNDEEMNFLAESLKDLVEGFLNQNIFFPNFFNSKFIKAKLASERIAFLIRKQINRIKDDNYDDSKCLLALLLEDSRYSEEKIVSELTGLLFAGSDTISHSMSFTLGLLASHKSQMDLVRNEVKEILPNEEFPPVNLYSQLSHITSSVKESLRLFPIAWVVAVINNTPTMLGPHNIPALTPIVINLRYVNRNPEWFPDPDSFKPSRFLDNNKNETDEDEFESDSKSNSQAELFSFSLGAHTCIGKFLAIFEARIILAELVKRFEFSTIDTYNLEQTRMYSTLHPINGLPLSVTPINFKL